MLTAREAVVAAFTEPRKKRLTRRQIHEAVKANANFEGSPASIDQIIYGSGKKYAAPSPVKKVGKGVYELDREAVAKHREAERLTRITADSRTEEDRLRDQVASLEADLKAAGRIIKGFEEKDRVEDRIVVNVTEALSTADLSVREVPAYIPRASKSSAKGHEFLALLSDAHYGEVVDPEEALGITYNTTVARNRILHYRDTVLRYAELRRESYPVDKLTLAVLGDMLSGNIHEELAITNEVMLTEQAVEMAGILFDITGDFSSEFKEVEVIIIPGNHPRTTKKPKHKTKFDNWEWIMGKMVQSMFGVAQQTNGNIKITVPKSLVHTHEIFGHRIGMWHGDGVKSASFAGIPFYGMRQQREAIQALMSQLGLPRIDMLVMGHFHQHLYWQGECDILINGSIKGGDEYGISTRLSAPDPIQVLLEFHPEHGLTAQEHISLKHIT